MKSLFAIILLVGSLSAQETPENPLVYDKSADQVNAEYKFRKPEKLL